MKTLIERKARATGTTVQLVDRGADDWDEQRWETICVDHGGVCSHDTRALATAWLSHPDEWCEDCMHGPGTLDGTNPDSPGASGSARGGWVETPGGVAEALNRYDRIYAGTEN